MRVAEKSEKKSLKLHILQLNKPQTQSWAPFPGNPLSPKDTCCHTYNVRIHNSVLEKKNMLVTKAGHISHRDRSISHREILDNLTFRVVTFPTRL